MNGVFRWWAAKTREQLDIPSSFQGLSELAEILDEWEDLAPVIGLSKIDISTIQHNHRISQCSASLKKWGEIQGIEATFLSLAHGLEKRRKMDVVEKLCQIFMTRQQNSVAGPTIIDTDTLYTDMSRDKPSGEHVHTIVSSHCNILTDSFFLTADIRRDTDQLEALFNSIVLRTSENIKRKDWSGCW